MDVRAVAVKANIDNAVKAIKEVANNGAFSVDFDNYRPELLYPVTLKEEMHEEIQAAFTFTLKFDKNTVSWD